tara:strand:+ start:86 stop:358 length:273 start_codon:yes stop_codon:yes gene_type:complete
MVKSSNFLGMQATSATSVTLAFYSSSNDGDDRDDIVLTIDSGAHEEVFKQIANAMTNNRIGGGGFVTIADDVNSVYVTPEITGVSAVNFG